MALWHYTSLFIIIIIIIIIIYKVECLWVSEWICLFVTDKLDSLGVYPFYPTNGDILNRRDPIIRSL